MIDIWRDNEDGESEFVQCVLSERAASMLIRYYNGLNNGWKYYSINVEYVGLV